MKILKLLLVFTLVSTIAVSCKETKKEEVQDDTVEMTEEVITIEWVEEESSSDEIEATESDAGASGAAAATKAKEAAPAAAAEESKEAVEEVVEVEANEVEELVVPAGVIAEELAETPVVYPGCTGSVEEIRACNRASFIAFLKDEFDRSLAESLGLKEGNHEIKSIVQVDTSGKLTALRVNAPHKILEAEMLRVIDNVPVVVPATKGGEAVPVTFILPIKFKVNQ